MRDQRGLRYESRAPSRGKPFALPALLLLIIIVAFCAALWLGIFIATLPKGVGIWGYLRHVRAARQGALADATILSASYDSVYAGGRTTYELRRNYSLIYEVCPPGEPHFRAKGFEIVRRSHEADPPRERRVTAAEYDAALYALRGTLGHGATAGPYTLPRSSDSLRTPSPSILRTHFEPRHRSDSGAGSTTPLATRSSRSPRSFASSSNAVTTIPASSFMVSPASSMQVSSCERQRIVPKNPLTSARRRRTDPSSRE